jgi:hypothetical protein
MKQTDVYLKTEGQKKAGGKKKFYFLAGLGLLATTALTFFGIYYWKKHKSTATNDQTPPDFKAEKPAPKTKSSNKGPAKKTAPSPGEKQADTKQPDAKAPQPPAFEPGDLAGTIRVGILKRQFLPAYTALKQIRNIADYKAVNIKFSALKTRLTRQTIVNALLGTFKLEAQRKVLFYEFKRIGLKYDGSKWTLGNIDITAELITTEATKVWKDPRTSVNVPRHMILGREVCKRGNFTLFEHAKSYFLVESKAVKSIQS